ncbi:type II toxin-antitoxin system ParD family antitoxin [Geminicoccaceae bacterium 1502E]|nr:type II toxin-antitoxin system ParD family antitoxin [Geminicoccaceae bacterium 1502E]
MARTLNFTLTDQQAAFIEEELQAGRARNASEIVRRGLELARRERELHEARLARLREEVQLAVAEAERGELLDVTVDALFDEVMEERRQAAP